MIKVIHLCINKFLYILTDENQHNDEGVYKMKVILK